MSAWLDLADRGQFFASGPTGCAPAPMWVMLDPCHGLEKRWVWYLAECIAEAARWELCVRMAAERVNALMEPYPPLPWAAPWASIDWRRRGY